MEEEVGKGKREKRKGERLGERRSERKGGEV